MDNSAFAKWIDNCDDEFSGDAIDAVAFVPPALLFLKKKTAQYVRFLNGMFHNHSKSKVRVKEEEYLWMSRWTVKNSDT